MSENETANTEVEEIEAATSKETTDTEAVPSEEAATEPIEPEAPAAPTESEHPAQTAASPSDDAKFKKNIRILLIVGAIIIAIALIVGGIVVANFLDENGLKSQVASDLSEDPIVADLDLSGDVVNETGFTVEDVEFNTFIHQPFSDQASITVVAQLSNGSIQGLNKYFLEYRKIEHVWKIQSAELLSQSYDPIAPIPDDVILELVPQLLEDIDRDNANDPDSWPLNIADYYSNVVDASIVENELDGHYDNVTPVVQADYDGAQYTGRFSLCFAWYEPVDPEDGNPRWTFYYGDATADTYYQIGAVPREGVSRFATEEEQEKSRNQAVSWNSFYTSIMTGIEFGAGCQYALLAFENIPHNTVDMECTITLDSTGEVLYQSERIAPNHVIDTIKLARPLDPGVYDATLTITSYERGTDRLTQLNSKITEPITIKVRDR